MISSVAHAEPVPSNTELFEMLKAQQATISELRTELKRMKQEQHNSVAAQPANVDTAAKQAGSEASQKTMAATAPAQTSPAYMEASTVPPTTGRGAYLGLFGGRASGGDSSTSQLGTVFYPEATGGPLAVDATGRTSSSSTGFVGTQIGYEWSYRSRLLPALKIDLLPAIEIEGLYLRNTRHNATLENSNARLSEQTFDDTFPTSTAVILANAVVGIRTPYQSITPYIGGGIGAARISIDGASSTQTDPAEPGINHFSTIPDSSVWGFAAQAKAGVRLALGDSAYMFGEYRYLYVGSVDQIFGSTANPTHAATTPWTVRFGDTSYNLFDVGVGLNF
jgi:opacity protein-like surface antigen